MVFRTPQPEMQVYRAKILLITRILIRPDRGIGLTMDVITYYVICINSMRFGVILATAK